MTQISKFQANASLTGSIVGTSWAECSHNAVQSHATRVQANTPNIFVASTPAFVPHTSDLVITCDDCSSNLKLEEDSHIPKSWTLTRLKEVTKPTLYIYFAPLTLSRAHKHPLRIPRRRLSASPRLRHIIIFLEQCASRPCPPSPFQDCFGSGERGLNRARQ